MSIFALTEPGRLAGALGASAEKAGASWLVVEQDQPDKGNTPLNAVKMSIEYLNTLK